MVKWTTEQSNAITANGGAVLVSAAAGSGKTAVLVERVIQMITDKDNFVSADQLLIATFSNAAASEMRQRIEKRLDNLITEHPEIGHYRRQKILLNSASISTIHSFCLSLVREHFDSLDIMPDFRVADQSELQLLKNQTAEEVIEEYYDSENPIFFDLVELISDSRDDKKLIDTVLTLYEFIMSHPFPQQWLDGKLDMYNSDISPQKSEWGQILLNYAAEALEYGLTSCSEALDIIHEFEDMTKAYEPTFLELNTRLSFLLETVQNGNWDKFVSTLQKIENPKLGRLSGDSPEKTKVQSIKSKIQNKIIKELKEKLFIATESEYKDDIIFMRDKIEVLFDLVKDFIYKFGENKRERNMVDFSDLEHMALSLLIEDDDANGYKKTVLANQISQKYYSVLVDEYQDTNEVQDLIFRCVSKDEENLFMVGDVKQSIYAFRQAMPEIFIERRKKSVPYDGINFPASIVLDKNFRSRSGICGGINAIFKKTMTADVGGVDYLDGEELVAGADYPKTDLPSTNVVIVDASSGTTNSRVLEAKEIASKIASMIDNGFLIYDRDTGGMRPCVYSDFCILLRAKTNTEIYEKELDSSGIPVWSDFSKNFFGSKEILFLLSFLSVIDNPLSDVDICSAMMSPIFGFTADDMSKLAVEYKNLPLYIAVTNASRDGDEKCAYFLSILDELRTYAAVSSVSDVIRKIFDLTSFDLKVSVMSGGEHRMSNLNMIIKQSEEYESSGYRGLSGFVRFMKRLMESGLDIPRNMTLPGNENVVKIMTIHRSKGLEFPICFVADCSKGFNLQDLKSNTLLHSKLGFSCKYRNPENLHQYSTIPQEAIKLEIKRDNLSEEMRVLYVALTRAKEYLFMMCTMKNPEKKIVDLINSSEKSTLSPFLIRSASSYADWILMSVLNLPESNAIRAEMGLPMLLADLQNDIQIEYVVPDEKQDEQKINHLIFKSKSDKNFMSKLEDRCRYIYPNIPETLQPTKMAVSDIASKLSSERDNILLKRPKFLYKSGLSPAEVGNAHHLFMQFADYQKAFDDPKNETERMVAMGYLRREEGDVIRMSMLQKFFHGSLAKRIFDSDRVFRELKFIIGADGNDDQNQTMIQGVADCIFFEGDEFVIVDYKTDYVDDAQILKDRYTAQLEIYKTALEQSFKAKAKELVIYSFWLGHEIVL